MGSVEQSVLANEQVIEEKDGDQVQQLSKKTISVVFKNIRFFRRIALGLDELSDWRIKLKRCKITGLEDQ